MSREMLSVKRKAGEYLCTSFLKSIKGILFVIRILYTKIIIYFTHQTILLQAGTSAPHFQFLQVQYMDVLSICRLP